MKFHSLPNRRFVMPLWVSLVVDKRPWKLRYELKKANIVLNHRALVVAGLDRQHDVDLLHIVRCESVDFLRCVEESCSD